MLLRLLLRSLFPGEDDDVKPDEEPWPTWFVALLMLLVIGAAVGIFLFFKYSKP